MRRKTKVGIIGIVFSISLVVAGYFFYTQIIVKGKGTKKIVIKGTEAEINRSLGRVSKEPNLSFESLLMPQPDAPTKKKGIGNFYVGARSAIVIDADTNTILHYQDGKKEMAIASLTKMMTAILVIEKLKNLEDEIVIIDEETVLVEGTKVGCPRSGYCVSNRLRMKEKISAQSLLEAMLMNSANDAAIALGKHIAGSQEKFADMMNDKAREIGLQNTNFCNPSGLDDDDNPGACYSSAYDLARITAYSLRYDEIWKIMKVKEKDVYSDDGQITHHIVNTDVLLDQLPNCLGGKTGFTYEAGKSLMMAAHHPTNRNHKIVAVILDDINRWEDMRSLISWSFAAYTWPGK
jgi:serine-type D-Ala-D-Ala carboxypeptidase (penicillin-binding protein 5/6)